MGKKKGFDIPKIGYHFDRSDLDRMGLFAEMSYLIGKGPAKPAFYSAEKGRQIIPGYPKSKCGTDDGYFGPFGRIFQKEGYFNASRAAYLERIKENAKNVSQRTFLPGGASKRHSGVGDYYGCFEKVTAFSPLTRKKPPRVKEPSNALTNPGKKGGPGFPDITINPFPPYIENLYRGEVVAYRKKYMEHKNLQKGGPFYSAVYSTGYFGPDPYLVPSEGIGPTYVPPKPPKYLGQSRGTFILSSPGKKLGGCKDGCFDKYPEHSNDKYKSPAQIMTGRAESSKVFTPTIKPKSMPTRSIVNYNIDFRVNAQNYHKNDLIVFK